MLLRGALLLYTRERLLDRLPLVVVGLLPRPLPRNPPPLTDDIFVTVEVVKYWRHV